MVWRKIIPLLIIVFDRGSSQVCNENGELLPDPTNCRKYFKCAQGQPSAQNCPGTLVFDVVLKICNWPQSTTCVVDLLPKKKKEEKRPEGLTEADLFKDDGDDDDSTGELTEEEEKRRKAAIASLFHVRDRKNQGLSSIAHRRRTRPRNSLTTTTTTAKPETRRNPVFGNRGSLLSFRNSQRQPSRGGGDRNSARDQLRAKTREELRNENRDKLTAKDRTRDSFLTKLKDQQDRGSSPGSPRTEEENEADKIAALKAKLKAEILRDLFKDDSSFLEPTAPIAPAVSNPKFEAIRCHTGASNELYPNPRNCRKYFKCQSGGPSLQSCPANLIFDPALKICNWPDAIECIEDPTYELPDTVSSDRHPAKNRPATINTINTDRFEEASITAPSVADIPSPSHGNVPSYKEALEREKLLTKQYPLFDKVKETVKTLDSDVVEKIDVGLASNPDNVKRVEFILTEENFDDLFPLRHKGYTYRRLLQAIGKFPAICNYLGREDESDRICRKTLATMFAHFTQETGGHNPSDNEYEEWRQGLNFVRESGCTDTSPGCGYNSNCEDKDSITKKWACGVEGTNKFKKYYGRGAKQLSYNFNYGQFSQAMFGDGKLLLDYPDFVATTWLNLASATWFYAQPQPPKPSMLHVIDGTWIPNSEDRRNGIEPGFGATINIINGGLECNTKDGRESKQALNRIAYYKQFAWYLYVDIEDETLGCAKQQQFTAGGSGALPIYWDKDWSHPFSCRLVNYQTAFSALVPEEYIGCVEENFNVSIR